MKATTSTVLKLGSAQTLAWASSYYLPAVLAAPIARELALPVPWVFAAFSLALVINGVLGPWAGRRIDRLGGRPVLMASNGVFVLGLLALAAAQGPWTLFAAWVVLGLAMAMGLYEAAFAALVRLYGGAARNPITGITLMAGFASTVGWPLSTLFEAQFGWRGACLVWAGLHVLIGLPLNAWLPGLPQALPPAEAITAGAPAAALAEPPQPIAAPRGTTAALAFVFGVVMFVSTAMAAHLPSLLVAAGATPIAAVAAAALLGPAQVAGRLIEFGALRRVHPLWSARASALLHPLGVGLLWVAGAPAAALFVLLHGSGNGVLTIARGTLPLALFGPAGYGARQGWLMLPGRFAQAAAPIGFGALLATSGVASLWLTLGLTAAAGVVLWLLPRTGPSGARQADRED